MRNKGMVSKGKQHNKMLARAVELESRRQWLVRVGTAVGVSGWCGWVQQWASVVGAGGPVNLQEPVEKDGRNKRSMSLTCQTARHTVRETAADSFGAATKAARDTAVRHR